MLYELDTGLIWQVSGNDAVGGCVLPLEQLIADAPQPGANGLYDKDEDGKHEFKEFTVGYSIWR
jgi:phosphatidylserine decarboxylase